MDDGVVVFDGGVDDFAGDWDGEVEWEGEESIYCPCLASEPWLELHKGW